eukprot:scaffold1221_cov237-Pinguiococcus_pyrenoidosus.AAC.10
MLLGEWMVRLEERGGIPALAEQHGPDASGVSIDEGGKIVESPMYLPEVLRHPTALCSGDREGRRCFTRHSRRVREMQDEARGGDDQCQGQVDANAHVVAAGTVRSPHGGHTAGAAHPHVSQTPGRRDQAQAQVQGTAQGAQVRRHDHVKHSLRPLSPPLAPDAETVQASQVHRRAQGAPEARQPLGALRLQQDQGQAQALLRDEEAVPRGLRRAVQAAVAHVALPQVHREVGQAQAVQQPFQPAARGGSVPRREVASRERGRTLALAGAATPVWRPPEPRR